MSKLRTFAPSKRQKNLYLDISARRRKETLATEGTQEQKNKKENMYLCSYVKKKK